jgi:hypothetical protein
MATCTMATHIPHNARRLLPFLKENMFPDGCN